MDKDKNAGGTKDASQKTTLLLIIVLVAAIVSPFLSSTVAIKAVNGKLAKLEAATGPEGEEAKAEEEAEAGKMVFYQPMEFLVNLADTEMSHYLKTTVSLGCRVSPEELKPAKGGGGHGKAAAEPQPEIFHVIHAQEPIIRDIIISIVSSYPMMSLVSTQGKRELKEALSARLKEQLHTDNLTVYFTAFTLQ